MPKPLYKQHRADISCWTITAWCQILSRRRGRDTSHYYHQDEGVANAQSFQPIVSQDALQNECPQNSTHSRHLDILTSFASTAHAYTKFETTCTVPLNPSTNFISSPGTRGTLDIFGVVSSPFSHAHGQSSILTYPSRGRSTTRPAELMAICVTSSGP